MAEISVIIPTYNRAYCLERCIDSVLKQTFKDIEIIVVDDGSTDNTQELLKQYSRKDDRLFYAHQENTGVSKARNVGMAMSKTNTIALLDSDDEWLPKKLELHYEFHIRNKWKISQTQEIWNRNGKRVNPPKHLQKQEGDIFEISLHNCMISPSAVLFEKKLILDLKGFREDLPACEDFDLWLKITKDYPVGLLKKDLMIRYGGASDQLSAKHPVMDRFRLDSLFDLKKNGNLNQKKLALLEDVLQNRLNIVQNGARKHKNVELLTWISTKVKEQDIGIKSL